MSSWNGTQQWWWWCLHTPEARWFFAAGLHIHSCCHPSWTDGKISFILLSSANIYELVAKCRTPMTTILPAGCRIALLFYHMNTWPQDVQNIRISYIWWSAIIILVPAASWCLSSSFASPHRPWTGWGPHPPCCSTPMPSHLPQMPWNTKTLSYWGANRKLIFVLIWGAHLLVFLLCLGKCGEGEGQLGLNTSPLLQELQSIQQLLWRYMYVMWWQWTWWSIIALESY